MAKNGKRPTVRQQKAIKAAGLDPASWLVSKNLPRELHVIHRHTNRIKIIPAA